VKWEDETPVMPMSSLAALAEHFGLGAALEAFAASREAELTVVMPRRLREDVWRFLGSHRVEAGGLLLGHVHRVSTMAPPSIVSITEFVPGRDFAGTGVSLALGTALWDDARPLLDGGFSVIGWVHSHPDLGAFFSGTDRRTQRAFFSLPFQVGLCIDPVRGEHAWFHGPASREDRLHVAYV
jgi:hypothetical protein